MNPWQNEHILFIGMWLVWIFWLLILYQLFTRYVTFIYFFCKEQKPSQFNWKRSFLVCITGKSKIVFLVQLELRIQLMRPGFCFFLHFFPLVGFILWQIFSTHSGEKWFLAILGLHFTSQHLILEGARPSPFFFIVHICFCKGTLALPGLCTLLWPNHCVWVMRGREACLGFIPSLEWYRGPIGF